MTHRRTWLRSLDWFGDRHQPRDSFAVDHLTSLEWWPVELAAVVAVGILIVAAAAAAVAAAAVAAAAVAAVGVVVDVGGAGIRADFETFFADEHLQNFPSRGRIFFTFNCF